MRTAFEILGLPATATPLEVKQRWRKLCSTLHPDRPTGNAVEFDEVRRAYHEALTEASAPKRCARCGGSGRTQQGHGFHTTSLTCPTCLGTGTL